MGKNLKLGLDLQVRATVRSKFEDFSIVLFKLCGTPEETRKYLKTNTAPFNRSNDDWV